MPKNVVFVIDKSGSMSGKKIQQVGLLNPELSSSLTCYGIMGGGFLGPSLAPSMHYEPTQDTRILAKNHAPLESSPETPTLFSLPLIRLKKP